MIPADRQAKDTAQRLRQFMEEAGYHTEAEFAAALGMSYENLYQYLAGKAKPGNRLQERLRGLGADVEWLMTGVKIPGKAVTGFAPFLGKIAATPQGKEYFEEFDGASAGIPFLRGSFFCLEIENDSLISAEPKPIYPGDICVFEANRQPKDGDIVAIHFRNNQRTVKIVKHLSRDIIELRSANKFRNYLAVKVKKTDIASYGVFVMKVDMDERMKRRFGIKT